MSDAALPLLPRPGRPARRWWGRVALAVLVIAVALGVLVGYRWWTSPDLFTTGSGTFRATPVSVKKGPAQLSISDPQDLAQDETIIFKSTRANLVTNTADVEATFSLCPYKRKKSIVGMEFGDLEEICPGAKPIRRGRVLSGDDKTYVLLTLTPNQPGEVQVDDVYLEYARSGSHLWQHGPDRVFVDVSFRWN